MKIAFINIMTPKKMHIGVKKKLVEEAKSMIKHDIDVFVLNREINGFIDNINYIDMNEFLSKKNFSDLYLKIFKLNILKKLVNLDKYDYIILRYPLMDFSSLAFSKQYGKKLITEHHGKYLGEIKSYRINFIFKSLQYFMEKYFSTIFFKQVFMMIGISNDVITEEKSRTSFNGKIFRHSNGIDPTNFSNRTIPLFENEFNILFMATNFAEWHGLDRLLLSLNEYTGTIKINILLVGEVNNKYLHTINIINSKDTVSIIQKGRISDKYELDNIYNSSHIAFNSIAMYRINMSESSTLKSKEYIIKHIPFVYAAPDPDLINVESFLYKIPNDDTIIDFNKIITFYKELDIEKMKKNFNILIKEKLTWDIKVKELLEAIKQ